jgi:hypothetical protein
MQLHRAIDADGQRLVLIGNVDLRQQGPCARRQRIGEARHRTRKGPVGDLGHAHDGLVPRLHPERLALRHENLGPDRVTLHEGEQERAGRQIALHQRAHVHVALGDHAVERGNHLLIGLLLAQNLELGLLGHDIGLRHGEVRFQRLDVLDVDGARLLCNICRSTSGLLRRQVMRARSRLACTC